LIDPILQSALELGDLEKQLTTYYNLKVDDAEQDLINAYFLSTTNDNDKINLDDFATLLEDQIVQLNDGELALYSMFKDIAAKRQNERNVAAIQVQTKKTKQARGAAILAAVIGVVAIVLFFYGQQQRVKAEENYGAAMQEKADKEKQDVKEILRIGTSFEEAEYYEDALILYDSATLVLKDTIHLQHDIAETNSLVKLLEERRTSAKDKLN
jgi:hypothetical protein